MREPCWPPPTAPTASIPPPCSTLSAHSVSPCPASASPTPWWSATSWTRPARSEERRVGKECRSRRRACQEKNKERQEAAKKRHQSPQEDDRRESRASVRRRSMRDTACTRRV